MFKVVLKLGAYQLYIQLLHSCYPQSSTSAPQSTPVFMLDKLLVGFLRCDLLFVCLFLGLLQRQVLVLLDPRLQPTVKTHHTGIMRMIISV